MNMYKFFVLLSFFICIASYNFAQTTVETLSDLTHEAEEGNMVAQKHLGDIYFGGGTVGNEVVAKDNEKAMYWYGRAAELGDAGAQYILGFLYRDIDKDKALFYMKKYAEQGFENGQAMLGYWYMGNDGFTRDDLQAALWLRKAAEQGNKQAAADLSFCYAVGRGVPKDPITAKHWKDISEEKEVETLDMLATIQWPNMESNVTNREYPLSIGISSKSKIDNVTLKLNGSQLKDTREIRGNGFDINVECNLLLVNGSNTIEISVRNASGLTQDSKTIVCGNFTGKLASIDWLKIEPISAKNDYKVKIGVKSETKIEDVSITYNNVPDRGIRTVDVDNYDMVVERNITLGYGINRIIASVRNEVGIAKAEKTIIIEKLIDTVPSDRRIAMIVGNSNYSDVSMNLTNPRNDATDVAAKLEELGFDVILKTDVTLQEMDKELTSFGLKARGYDVALFYYAGHGIQSKGVNYLLPTDIENLAEDNIKYKCVDMERILGIMEDSKCKLNIVVLDACRNDPISRSWHRSVESHGLSLMNAPEGTIISFSTAPGHTALDGTDRNSPYTQAFLNALDYPNLDVLHFLKMVGSEVIDKTKNVQRPWMSSSFTGDFYFNRQ